MKKCADCGEIKHFSAFPKSKNRKDGHHPYCKICNNRRSALYVKNNRVKRLAWERKYEAKNKEKRQKQKAVVEKSLKTKQYRKHWREANKSKVQEYCRTYQATKLGCTPAWLSSQDRIKIAQIYDKAVKITLETGIPHEVDHIVPLQGKNVRGLHVPWNLQILPSNLNRSKGNR